MSLGESLIFSNLLEVAFDGSKVVWWEVAKCA